jgi:hypothetical protein
VKEQFKRIKYNLEYEIKYLRFTKRSIYGPTLRIGIYKVINGSLYQIKHCNSVESAKRYLQRLGAREVVNEPN